MHGRKVRVNDHTSEKQTQLYVLCVFVCIHWPTLSNTRPYHIPTARTGVRYQLRMPHGFSSSYGSPDRLLLRQYTAGQGFFAAQGWGRRASRRAPACLAASGHHRREPLVIVVTATDAAASSRHRNQMLWHAARSDVPDRGGRCWRALERRPTGLARTGSARLGLDPAGTIPFVILALRRLLSPSVISLCQQSCLAGNKTFTRT